MEPQCIQTQKQDILYRLNNKIKAGSLPCASIEHLDMYATVIPSRIPESVLNETQTKHMGKPARPLMSFVPSLLPRPVDSREQYIQRLQQRIHDMQSTKPNQHQTLYRLQEKQKQQIYLHPVFQSNLQQPDQVSGQQGYATITQRRGRNTSQVNASNTSALETTNPSTCFERNAYTYGSSRENVNTQSSMGDIPHKQPSKATPPRLPALIKQQHQIQRPYSSKVPVTTTPLNSSTCEPQSRIRLNHDRRDVDHEVCQNNPIPTRPQQQKSLKQSVEKHTMHQHSFKSAPSAHYKFTNSVIQPIQLGSIVSNEPLVGKDRHIQPMKHDTEQATFPEYMEIGPTQQCVHCTRSFTSDRIDKHMESCKKLSQGQIRRKVFDPTVMRTRGTEAEVFLKQKSVKKNVLGIAKGAFAMDETSQSDNTSNWRVKHEQFRQSLIEARMVSKFLAKGGKAKDLPPTAPAVNTGKPCPSCGRKFAEASWERHTGICVNLKHGPPKRKK
ncbi:Zinc finger C2HC domain-containing protein 1C [Batrachochytrium dendrobatidis]